VLIIPPTIHTVHAGESSGSAPGQKGLRAGKKETPFARLFAGLVQNLKNTSNKNKTTEEGLSPVAADAAADLMVNAGTAGKQAPAKTGFPGGFKVSTAENRGSGANLPLPAEEKAETGPETPQDLLAAAAGTAVSTGDSGGTRNPGTEGRNTAPAFSGAGMEDAAKQAETWNKAEGKEAFPAGDGARGFALSGEAGRQEAPEERAGIAESKSRKSRDKVNLEVRDFRSAAADHVQNQELKVTEETGSKGETRLVVELRSGGSREPADMLPENRPARSFENILARELHQNLNGDIVRHASVVLRDGNEGTIRLSLKPESLGNVKIHLEMTENKIAGRIVVESGEVLRAFEREIRSLEQAFRDSGFDAAVLEMAVASDGRNGADRQWKEAETGPFYSARLAASAYDAPAGDTESVVLSSGGVQSRIDMLA
jgi:flagellar hook-length control protein FliK